MSSARGAACTAATLALVVGCGGEDREAILAAMEDARSAVVEGDAEAACGLLTRHGRKRALEYQVDFAEEGTPVPTKRAGVPQTCEEILREERDLDPESVEDLRRATFDVVSVDGDRARVRLQAPDDGPAYGFTLVKADDGWRIDDSDAVPSGY